MKNYASILAYEQNSSAIMASSLGGGGGAGYVVTAVGTSGAEGSVSGQVSVGQDGGGGGVGGGGGNAAHRVSSSLSSEMQVDITVGGTGGTGGHGADVTVTNSATIQATGTAAAGVIARSIGGGGDDSQSIAIARAATGTATSFGQSLTATVGRNGAAAGDGGAVTVNNTGTLHIGAPGQDVDGDNDPEHEGYGIFAQSVGGGGGEPAAPPTTSRRASRARTPTSPPR